MGSVKKMNLGGEHTPAPKKVAVSKSSQFQIGLSNDRLFYEVFKDFDLIRPLLEELLEAKVSVITEYQSQREVRDPHPDGGSIRLDCKLVADGRPVDVEIQNRTYVWLPQRLRYYSSMLDYEQVRDDKVKDYDLPESYVIMFLKGNLGASTSYARYEMCCTNSGGNERLRDGRHIIVVNYADYGKDNDVIGQLCALLRGEAPQDEYGRKIQARMDELLQDISVKDAVFRQQMKEKDIREEGKLQAQAEAIRSMQSQGISLEDAVKFLGINPLKFTQNCDQYGVDISDFR